MHGNKCLDKWCPSTSLQVLLEAKVQGKFKTGKVCLHHLTQWLPMSIFKLNDNLGDRLSVTFDLFIIIWTIFLKFPPQEHFFSDREQGILATLMLKECCEGRIGAMEENKQLYKMWLNMCKML